MVKEAQVLLLRHQHKLRFLHCFNELVKEIYMVGEDARMSLFLQWIMELKPEPIFRREHANNPELSCEIAEIAPDKNIYIAFRLALSAKPANERDIRLSAIERFEIWKNFLECDLFTEFDPGRIYWCKFFDFRSIIKTLP